MFTVWPAVVEAYYLLERDGGPSQQVLHWLQAAHVRIVDLRMQEIRRMWQLIRKYRDLPMDLADAALVAACERLKIRKVFTVDRRDFLIYRPTHIDQFEVLP
jgi:predicted nucleic acid-binding protein